MIISYRGRRNSTNESFIWTLLVYLRKCIFRDNFLQLCTSVRRKTTVNRLFTLLCSVVDVERYWTVIDIACVIRVSCLCAATK